MDTERYCAASTEEDNQARGRAVKRHMHAECAGEVVLQMVDDPDGDGIEKCGLKE